MILRRNVVLGLVTIGLAAAHVLLQPPKAVQREVLPLMPELAVDAVTGLRLAAPGGEVVTTIKRDAESGTYTVLEKEGADARGQEVYVLLTELAAMTDLDVVATGPDAAADFGLDDAGSTRIELEGPPGTAAVLRAVAAEGGAAFVHLEGSDRVVRVPRFRVPTAEPRGWFDSYVLVPVSGRELREISLEGGGLASPVLVRARRGDVGAYEDGDGQPLNERLVSELVQRLRVATALDVVPRPAEGAETALTLGISSYDGTSFQVVVTDMGSTDASSPRPGIAFRSDLSYAVEVSPAWLEQVLDVARRF